MYDLKVTQINMQHNLIRDLMLYKFKLGSNDVEITKNVCCTKGNGVVNYSNQMVKILSYIVLALECCSHVSNYASR